MKFSEFIKIQAEMHPAMQPQDAVKMCYQAAFGAEHAIPDKARAAQYLQQELDSTLPDAGAALFETISDKIVRINLAAWKSRGLPADWLLNMFLHTRAPGESFSALIKCVENMAANSQLPFTAESWSSFMSTYSADMPHPVHHSEAYREAEKPAYRIACVSHIYLLPLLERMAVLPGGVVAIDGRAASGKSSLALALSQTTGAGVVCMDDFFLPVEKRTPQRLSAPGGNVDYERFAAQVLPQLRSPEAFSYPRFDCSVMAINGGREVAASPWRIVEGSYSHHPELGNYMDIRVFRTVQPAEQLRRIRIRNGETMLRRFESDWIPMEEKYFSHFGIEEKADIII